MNHLKIIILTFLLISMATSQQTRVIGKETKKDEPARVLKSALKNYTNRNYTKALNEFVEALNLIEEFQKSPEIFPSDKYQGNNATPHKNLAAEYAARAAAKASKFTEADKYFAMAIEFEPENSQTWYYYGDYLFDDRRKTTEATNAFFNVIKYAEPNLSSSNSSKVRDAKNAMAGANYKLGQIFDKKDANKAIEYYNIALDINPAYYQARLMLTTIYEDQKDYKKVEENYTILVDYFTDKAKSSVKRKQLANALVKLGIAYFNNRNYSKSISTLDKVFDTTGVKNLQKNAAYYYLGMSYHKLKNNTKALANLNKVSGSYKASADYEIDIIKNPDKYAN